MPAVKRLFTVSKGSSLNGNQHKVSWKDWAQVSKNRAGNISQLNALLKVIGEQEPLWWFLFDFFSPLCLSLSCPSWTNAAQKQWHRSSFQRATVMLVPDQSVGLFFIHSFSAYVCVDNKRENLAYTSLESFICVLAVFFVVIMTVLLLPRMRHGAFGPPHEVQLATHRPEKSVVIRLVEKLHSADNPTEIAHGFPVPEVENKHTPLEYIMRVPNKSPNWSVQSPHFEF